MFTESDKIEVSQSDLEALAPSRDTLLSRIEEWEKITRFFRKTLTEALRLEATSISLISDGAFLTVTVSKAKSDLKSLKVRDAWFDSVVRWLGERTFAIGSKDQFALVQRFIKGPDGEISVSVRLPQGILTFRATRAQMLNGSRRVILSELAVAPMERVLGLIGVSPIAQYHMDRLLSAPVGILCVGGVDVAQTAQSVALILSLRDAHHIGPMSSVTDWAEVAELSSSHPLVVSLEGEDGIEMLQRFRPHLIGNPSLQLIGVLCQALVPKVCASCGKTSVVDPKLIEFLPDALKPDESAVYQVGRGCDDCGHTGIKGLIALQSICSLDSELREMLVAEADSVRILERAYPLGTRSLLEDGVRKAFRGVISLEALYKVSRTMPAGYLRFVRHKANGGLADQSTTVLEVGDDFYTDASMREQPIVGKDAFTSKANASINGTLVPRREKPLVLIVEDDPDQRAILEMVVKSAKYDVHTATDGTEAIVFLEKTHPDLIVSDLMMPEMDGATLVKKIRATDSLKHIPVLILTVVSDTEKEFNLLDLGADDYCEKTIQRKILLKRIEKLVKRKDAGRA